MNIIILLISIILIVNANTILIKIKMLMARWEEGVLPWVSPEVSTGSQAAGAPGRQDTWHRAPGTRQGDGSRTLCNMTMRMIENN